MVEARRNMKIARKELRKAILRAKSAAWKELLDDLDRDPWGRVYKLVVKKLASSCKNTTASLSPDCLEATIDELFPTGNFADMEHLGPAFLPSSYLITTNVTADEVRAALKRRKSSRSTIPGPDGLSRSIWNCASDILFDSLAHLFQRCLNENRFPAAWKLARLVLIPKGDTKFRPICLLDDVGKALERVIASRIKKHLDTVRAARLSDFQFGFREGRSTMNALELAKEFINGACAKKKYTVAVSIDIKNAFNSLPIFNQMERKGFPPYLVNTIRSYFFKRIITYPDCEGKIRSRLVYAGVPQGSVLGSLL